jgi:hypothetical protein
MSILSWNCRGLGHPRTVQELMRLVRTHGPKIVFLSKTHQQNSRVTYIKGRLGFSNCFVVDGHGKGGGLTLYWDHSIKLNINSYGQHHIDTLIWDGINHAAWRGTFVYGEARTQDRHHM